MTETTTVRAQALFLSALQGSETPTPEQVRAAVAQTLDRFGLPACAAMVAQCYGEDPTGAVRRMLWALATERVAFPEAAAPPPPPRSRKNQRQLISNHVDSSLIAG